MSLYVIATPIAHPDDMTLRGIHILKNCQYIIGEEAKTCRAQLKSWDISPQDKTILLLNEHSKSEDLKELLEVCHTHDVALISDCGTPGFCDPGADLIDLCYKSNIKVTTIPGPSSLMTFLSMLGTQWKEFTFKGFPPRETNERIEFFKTLAKAPHPQCFLEAPYRLHATLEHLEQYCSNKKIYLGINLTAENQEFYKGSIKDIRKKVKAQKAPFIVGLE